MKDSKLVDILKRFDSEEIETLKKFMATPYFVKRQTLRDFSALVLNEYPEFEGIGLDEKILYRTLYPGKHFQYKTILRLMAEMISSVNQFLSTENFLRDQDEHGPRLMEELRKKGIGHEFQRVASKLNREFESGKKDQRHYYILMQYENELDNYYNLSKEHLGYSQYLQKKANALDTFFISAKLRLVCDMVNRKNILSYDYEISLLDFVLEYVEKNTDKFENHSAVSIYYRILLTLTNPLIEDNYFKLVNLLEKAINDFTREELKEMYLYAKNYCIKQLNSGRIEYANELFKLYCKLIDIGLIYKDQQISQWDYKNIVSIGLRLAEFEWTENFIHSNKERLHPEFMEAAYTYNLANLYNEKKEFQKALKTLTEFKSLKQISEPGFEDTFYNLDSRTLLLKIYYELNDQDPLYAIIRSFTLFLVRNKSVSENQRNLYLNLLRYTKKLAYQRQKRTSSANTKNVLSQVRQSIKKLKNEININKNVANLSWLHARVEEFEKEIG